MASRLLPNIGEKISKQEMNETNEMHNENVLD